MTEQSEHARETRDTGGDASAAASIEEREAVAEDRDDLFGDEAGEEPTEDEAAAGQAPDAPRAKGDIPDASAAVEPPD